MKTVEQRLTGCCGVYLSCDRFIGLDANSRDVPFILLAQDLKDFGREAGNVSFADIDRDTPGQGYVTFI